jgi:hypothetical protein
MSDDDARELFVMLMHGAAADWMNTQLADSVREPSLDRLTDSFKEHYFKPKELRWRDASQIWREKQLPQEKVLDYIVRIQKTCAGAEFAIGSFENDNFARVSTWHSGGSHTKRGIRHG